MSGRRTILIADDVGEVRRLVASFLQKLYGCEVVEARDGLEAALALFAGSIDLVITDLDMPGMGGLELAALIRRSPATAHIPIVTLTLRDSDADRQRNDRFGIAAHLAKPFRPQQLRDALAQLGWMPTG
ncbi:MAG: hypothetical protein A3H96_13440 [Acidobacteria bacterium RIFCSPLOWO2_02_FULL_67_36]|nr:MAG: hypothetical protein A3H96_13440 [Acidobacteria bacterium RIFCSPLOWO2_02_FULL_67_36]OFW18551.1 MAG: hypothetical protein A3G21_20995 [Acidobacteria bacterium RIFCSPLOWO2_12_FULL_66_21]